jgi:7-cyano-7-deazaguanine reductase
MPSSSTSEGTPRRELLEVFDNPYPERDYRVVHTCPEFTSVCPKTGQPDFATIVVDYVPDRLCLELKALKFYFFSYREEGIFFEAVVNRILDDLVAACRPRRMTIRGEFNVRGGISSVVTAEHVGSAA